MTTPLMGPFAALRPAAERAAQVAAPPYDVVTADEARQRAAGNPASFLHVSRAEIDLPDGVDPYAPEVYAKAAENMEALIAGGVLVRDPVPCFYVYRMSAGGHVQTGIAGGASVAAYDGGRIRRHELTRPDKETDRVRQIEAVAAHTGPVLVVHRENAEIADVVWRNVDRPPAATATVDGVEHAVWAVSDPGEVGRLTAAFEGMDALYIADGHHRSAAASRVAATRRDAGDGAAGTFLAVAFPRDQVRILDYNRLVRDLAGLDADALLTRIGEDFEVHPADGPVRPDRPRRFGLYLAGRWYALTVRRHPPADAPPVELLDVSLLTERLLAPVLGIGDARTDPRIDFLGGGRGLEALAARVDSGDFAAAVALHPTSLDDLMAVADAGQIMPPKSTWFDPKLADGLLSLPLE